jgi:hypothetical protein
MVMDLSLLDQFSYALNLVSYYHYYYITLSLSELFPFYLFYQAPIQKLLLMILQFVKVARDSTFVCILQQLQRYLIFLGNSSHSIMPLLLI